MRELNIKFKSDGTADILSVDSKTIQQIIVVLNSKEKEPGLTPTPSPTKSVDPVQKPRKRYSKKRKLGKHHWIEKCQNPTCIRPENKKFRSVRPKTKFCSRACCTNYWTTTRQIEAKKREQEKVLHVKKGTTILKGDTLSREH